MIDWVSQHAQSLLRAVDYCGRAVLTFGISVGLPYYNMPFFYDYYKNTFNWPLHDITLGFPLAALLTLWVGPVLVPRFSPRKLIVLGTLCTFLAFFGFSRMTGSISTYYFLWFVYTFGYILSGPYPAPDHHFPLVQAQSRRCYGDRLRWRGSGRRGRSVAHQTGDRTVLIPYRSACGGLHHVLCLAFCLVRPERSPSDVGQFPDGAPGPTQDQSVQARSFGYLLRQPAFWLLLIGSLCSIGSIGAINQHMKLVFKDQGFTDQAAVNAAWSEATRWILWSSIAGRLLIGRLADMFPMKHVMTVTYFVGRRQHSAAPFRPPVGATRTSSPSSSVSPWEPITCSSP